MKKVACVIVDRNAPQFLFDYLEKQKIEYIKSGYIKNIIEAVSTHPDMQICYVGDNKYVCEPTMFEYYSEKLSKYGVNLIKGERSISIMWIFTINWCILLESQ